MSVARRYDWKGHINGAAGQRVLELNPATLAILAKHHGTEVPPEVARQLTQVREKMQASPARFDPFNPFRRGSVATSTGMPLPPLLARVLGLPAGGTVQQPLVSPTLFARNTASANAASQTSSSPAGYVFPPFALPQRYLPGTSILRARHIPNEPVMMPLTGEGQSYNRLNYLKPSGDRYLFRSADAEAVWDLMNRNQVGMQFDLYSRRLMGDYVPTVNDPHYFPPNRLELGGGPDMGQNGNNYGNIVGASNGKVPFNIMSRAREAPVLVTGVLNSQNVMQEWRPLEMYLRELWQAADTGKISPSALDAAIRAASGGALADVHAAIADLVREQKTRRYFRSLGVNNKFVSGLTKQTGIPSYVPLLSRITDYSDRSWGDVVAISALDPSRKRGALTTMGLPNHDFRTGIPGLHLGDTIPVPLYEFLRGWINQNYPTLQSPDGTTDPQIRALVRGDMARNKPLIVPGQNIQQLLERLAIDGRRQTE